MAGLSARGRIAVLFAVVVAVIAASQAIFAQGVPTAEGAQDAAAAPTLLAVASEYVKVVGGVVAGLITLFGLPLTYQTFRKTRAEITKINLESEKLRQDIGGASGATQGQQPAGGRAFAPMPADPRYGIPLLILVDALIAYFYYRIALFAVGLLPIPGVLAQSVSIIVFVAIFYPVFDSARRIKKQLGPAAEPDAEPAAAAEGSPG